MTCPKWWRAHSGFTSFNALRDWELGDWELGDRELGDRELDFPLRGQLLQLAQLIERLLLPRFVFLVARFG